MQATGARADRCRPHSVDATECGHHLSPVPPSCARIGQGRMHTRSGRRARFCRRQLKAGAAERATRLAVRRGFHGHRGRPRGLQSWPGGGRRASFLNIHVHMTHATSHYECETSNASMKRRTRLEGVPVVSRLTSNTVVNLVSEPNRLSTIVCRVCRVGANTL